MISKQLSLASAAGCLGYISRRDKAVFVESNLAAQGWEAMSQEFAFVTAQNTRKQNKYCHVILSLLPGETRSLQQWQDICQSWREGMHQEFVQHLAQQSGEDPAVVAAQTPGYEDCPYAIWMHHDRQHQHVHMLLSVITWDGKTVSDSFERYRSSAVCRQIEAEFGLAPGRSKRDKVAQAVGHSPQHSDHEFLRQAIRGAAADQPTLMVLLERLQQEGVQVEMPRTRTGKVKGIKYRWDEQSEWITGTDLGQAFTYPGLAKHLQVELPTASQVPRGVTEQGVPAEKLPRKRLQRRYRQMEQQVMKSWPQLQQREDIDTRILFCLKAKAEQQGRTAIAQDIEVMKVSPRAMQLRQSQGDAAARHYLLQVAHQAELEFQQWQGTQPTSRSSQPAGR